jgi:hypothetical protein
MGTWGGGGSLIAFPTNSSATATQIEYQKVALQAANTSPFSGAQQIQDWGNSYAMCSVQLPPMNASDGQNWIFFFDELDGIVNVFQFPNSFVTDPRFSYWITSDGTHSKYFRLKEPNYKATVKEGAIYYITFEAREAI